MALKSPSKKGGWGTKLSHPQFQIEPCPNCEFPEADGGYCPECGWTQFNKFCPHCLNPGRRSKEAK